MFLAFSASIKRSSALPLVPSSPCVRSIIPHFLPNSICLSSVPPQEISTSSGWAPKAKMSSFTMANLQYHEMVKKRCGTNQAPHLIFCGSEKFISLTKKLLLNPKDLFLGQATSRSFHSHQSRIFENSTSL